MGTFKNAVVIMFRRPFIIIYFGIIMLALDIINYKNPILPVLSIFGEMAGGNFLESIVSFLQLLFNPSIFLTGLLFFLAFLIVASLLSGLFFSGYMNIIKNALDGKPKFKGEFLFGIKKYFLKISKMTFKVLSVSSVFIIFMAIVLVPAIVMTKSIEFGKPVLLILTLLVDIISAMVVFFGIMFFRIYITFWFPAAINHEDKPFTLGKNTADVHFWDILGRFVIFDIVFIAMQWAAVFGESIFSDPKYSIAIFLVNWILKTLFFATFTAYVFSFYKIVRGKLEQNA